MNKAELIKGIQTTINGLKIIESVLTDSGDEVVTKEVTKEEVTKEVISEPTSYTEDQLKAMKYNEFKKYAASLGVKCTGSREEIMQRILALNGEEVSEDMPEEVEEEVVSNKFEEQAKDIIDTTEVDDIIEALADVGIKATKKNLLEKLTEALENGLLEAEDDEESEEDDSEDSDEAPVFDIDEEESEDEEYSEEEDSEDDSDEETEEDESEDEDSEEEITPDSYYEEVDPEGFNEPSSLTKARKKAMYAKNEEIINDFYSGKLTIEDMNEFFEKYALDKDIALIDENDEEEALVLYIALKDRLIDNDGEEHEDGDPYEVGDNDMCCGHKLKYDKSTKKYICEVCGAEYEAEE